MSAGGRDGPVERSAPDGADDVDADDESRDSMGSGSGDAPDPLARRVVTLHVEPAERTERLDRFVAGRLRSVARGQIQRLIREGRVTIDGTPAWRASQRVGPTTTRVVVTIPPAAAEPPLVLEPARVLLQDEHLLVVDKPSGWPVVARLARAGEDVRRAVLRLLGPGAWAHAAHRLDRATSGVLVFARTSASARALGEAFMEGRVRKSYVARVASAPDPPRGRIDLPIDTPGAGGPRIDPARGKPALTLYRTLGPAPGGGVRVLLRPHTGRTHQLRLHLKALGRPILGDAVHGGPPAERLALHAWSLRFPHPATGAPVHVRAPLPPGV